MIKTECLKKPLVALVATLLTVNSVALIAEGFENSVITGVQFEYNNTTWAAANLIDNDDRTRWLSRQQTNDINILLDSTGDPRCFEGLSLKNYTNSGRNIKEFALLTTSDDSLAGDFGTAGWQPIVAEENPTDLIDYLSWAQGARIVSVDSEYNSTTWAAEHINDGDTLSRWLSKTGRNVIEYNFDTDWDNSTGDGITIDELEVLNYGTDDRALREFQIEITRDGSTWTRLEVPTSKSGDPEYIYSRDIDGGVLGLVDSTYPGTTWKSNHINDGDQNTRWLSPKGNNTIDFTFNPDRSLFSGAEGDVNDLFNLEKVRIRNYGVNDDRSIRQFQVAVKTVNNPEWHKIRVPGAAIGESNYNFAMSHQGGVLSEVSDEYNNTSWAAKNIHDGDQNTLWLSRSQASRLAFVFNPNEDSDISADDDLFRFEEFYLLNYGNDDRSIKDFQIQVKAKNDTDWRNIRVPGASVGDPNFNFSLVNNGGTLINLDPKSQYNTTSWAAKNIQDGSSQSRWLSGYGSNVLEFTFDVNQDGSAATTADEFQFDRFVLHNYGNDDRSINEFQVEVLTATSGNQWTLIPAPGAAENDPDFNYALVNNGGELSFIGSEYNSTSWAAANIHDGDLNTRWLSRNANTVLEFEFDVDGNGLTGQSNDEFTPQRVFLKNYGADDRSIRLFQMAYKTANTDWQYIEVPGSVAGQSGYNFALPAHGGTITAIDSEYNSTSWAAANLHDGQYSTRWLSRKQDNTIDFAFDTDRSGSTGESINLSTVELINYGTDDRSVNQFKIQYRKGSSLWQDAASASGDTIFTAAMSNAVQTYELTPLTGVTEVRFQTISNHGDPRYTGLRELRLIGDTVGPIYSFEAQMSNAGQYFEFDPNNLPENITSFRLETVTNHGDPNYIGAKEFKIIGNSTIRSTIFNALQNDSEQEFVLDPEDVPDRVLGVRLRTISNHGDPRYIGAKEFKVLGPSITETTIFSAKQMAEGQSFRFDNDDVVEDVASVRIVTINNHGDRSYIGAREFEVRGPSVTESKTFIAQMGTDPETFTFDFDDVPQQVTDARFITINNHGDGRYIGVREIELIGPAVTAAHSFYLPQTIGPHRIVLDPEDRVSDIAGVRLVTINNHGDPSYVGLRELRLFGTPVTPSYIFKGENITALQTFNFEPINAKYLRLHTMTSYGDRSYIAAAELSLVEGNCAAGQWSFDESGWNGTSGEVIDSSGNGFNGVAKGFGNGQGAYTASSDRAIPGDIGTCRYSEFDGVDDYLQIEDADSLDNTSQITLSAWFNANSFEQTNGSNARGILSKRPSVNSNISYGLFFQNGAGGRLHVDIDSQNDRFTTQTEFNTNQWYHLSVVFDGTLPETERVTVYIDGVLEGRYPESSTFIPNTNSDFFIGNLYTGDSTLKVFDGSIDEVYVVPFAYSQSQVNRLMRKTRPCDVVELDHIQITHKNSGVSCAAHSVDLKACANASCSEIYSGDDIDFTLQKNAGGSISDLGTYTISGATGMLNNAEFNETDIGNFQFTGRSSQTNNVLCKNSATGTDSCDYEVTSSGFIVTSGDYGIAQSCGVNTFVIQAVESPTSSNAACVPTYSSNNYPLTFSYNYMQPDPASVVNPAEATIEGQVHTATQTGTAIQIEFDNEAKAQIDVNYAEAGLISVTVNDADGNLSSTTAMLGFVPSQLTAEWADGDPNNMAAIDEQVVISGQCANGIVLQNYVPFGQYGISATRTAPTDGEIASVNPAIIPNDLENLVIANNTNVAPNSGTVAVDVSGSANTKILNLNYDETATLEFNVTDTNYLGRTIETALPLTGSFSISHYVATTNAPRLAGTCNAFSYVGELIDWEQAPEITLTAKNGINATTEFADVLNQWSYVVNDISTGVVGNTYTENTINDNSTIAVNNDNLLVNEVDDVKVDGSRKYILSGQRLQYQKTRMPDVPFDADVNLTIPASAFVDQYGYGIKTDTSDPAFLPLELSNIDGSEIVYGRIKVASTFSSELQDLPWRAELQFFNASEQWQRQASDNCSVLTQDHVTIDGKSQFDVKNNPPKYELEGSDGTTYLKDFENKTVANAISGFITLPFAAPGEGNIGSLDIDVDLTTFSPHLRWDWDDNGTGSFVDSDGDGIDDTLDLNLPTTNVSFGRYRGNDRIIYKRER